MSPWTITVLLICVSIIEVSYGRHRMHHRHDEYCYATTEEPYLYFASKTSYQTVYYQTYINTIPHECSPRQMWMLIRHGTRYPLRKKMEGFQDLDRIRAHIISNHRSYRGTLCKEDVDLLKSWKFDNMPLTESDHLTEQGCSDLQEMGNRTRNRFFRAYSSNFINGKKFQFQYTNHEKTKLSAEAFAAGLYEREPIPAIPKSTNEDLLTRIYPACKIKPLPNADDPPDEGRKERNLFKQGPVIENVVRKVNHRLGFWHGHNLLTIEDVENMYDMCRYEKSWNFQITSPWCACFLDSELQALEYVADLAYYYNSGHGFSGNLRSGCPLVRDIIDRFRDIANNKHSEEPDGVFYFGHSTTIYNLVARLGIMKDSEHLTSNNYHNMTNRTWRTSLIAPFTGNFASIMLRCNTGERNRVVFYHNESPFKFPGCQGYVCSWNAFENMYRNVTDPSVCNFDICVSNGTKTETDKTTSSTDKTHDTPHSTYTNALEMHTTDRSNAIIQTIPNTNNENHIKVLQRKRTQLVKKEIPNDQAVFMAQSRNLMNLNDHEINEVDSVATTFNQKSRLNNKEIYISLFFIIFVVGFVAYTIHKRHKKVSKVMYQNLDTLQLRDINE